MKWTCTGYIVMKKGKAVMHPLFNVPTSHAKPDVTLEKSETVKKVRITIVTLKVKKK